VQLLPSIWLEKYFDRVEDEFQICKQLRQAVSFTRVNLADLSDTRSYRDFDVIFCRNLLIYFDDQSRRNAGQTLYDALSPGGFVCLGHSESMSRISSLYRVRRFPDAIVYQKPTEAP
jgi:chemotaxis protein methyltransferase CheR